MAVRIYSLAKDLGLDSKELVDLCARIGILNKGSALASLEDDEIAKIRNYLAERSAPAQEVAKEAPKPVREPIREAPIRELGKAATAKRDIGSVRKPAKPVEGKSTEGVQEPADSQADRVAEAVAVEPSAELTSDSQLTAGVAGPAGSTTEVEQGRGEPAGDIEIRTPGSQQTGTLQPGTMRAGLMPGGSDETDVEAGSSISARVRETRPAEPSRDFSSMNMPGKVRVIGRTKPAEVAKPNGAQDAAKGPRKQREPVINLAKIPKSAAPSPAARSQEPAALKPIVKLTPEVLKGVQQQQQQPMLLRRGRDRGYRPSLVQDRAVRRLRVKLSMPG